MRKLEEDGYIYKMQGKTMITGQLARDRRDFSISQTPALNAALTRLQKQNIRSMFKTEDVW